MFDELAHARRRAQHARRSHAALARRDRQRSASRCRRCSSSPRSGCADFPPTHVDARQIIITDDDYTRAEPQPDAIAEAAQRLLMPLLRDGQIPVMGGYIGSAQGNGVTTTLGRGGSRLQRVARRCRACRRRRSRSGPTSTACSRPIRASCKTSQLIERIALRRGVRARVVRREGAAPEHDRAGGHEGHSGLDPQLAAPRGHGHAHHLRRAAAPGDGHRRQEWTSAS